MFEDDRPVAHVGHLVEAVGDEDDRAALVLELSDAVHALALEGLVADGQHLVDQQDSGSTCTATAKASRTYMPDE